MKRILIKPLKVFMPEIKRVYAGKQCISPKFDCHHEPIPPLGAHTHFCSHDRQFKTICVWHEDMIFNLDGTPSDLMWHEYAHVIDAENFRGVFTCGDKYHTYAGDKEFQDLGHGPSWEKVMRDLGQIPSRSCEGPKGKDIWAMYYR